MNGGKQSRKRAWKKLTLVSGSIHRWTSRGAVKSISSIWPASAGTSAKDEVFRPRRPDPTTLRHRPRPAHPRRSTQPDPEKYADHSHYVIHPGRLVEEQ